MATSPRRWLDSMLLDERARIRDPMNQESIARSESRAGHALEVSLWIHPAPSLSYFSFCCNKMPDPHPDFDFDFEGVVFEDKLIVVGAAGRFVLLWARFDASNSPDEYFMYKIGDGETGESALLDSVPLPNGYRLPALEELGIVPLGHGGNYLLASLCLSLDPLAYRLHLYSSENRLWRTIQLVNPCPDLDKVITSKVISLEKCVLGWVDFRHGMLICDLHEENPVAQYIPLPEPLPENRFELYNLPPGPSTKLLRDLIYTEGLIKLVEIEHRVLVTTEEQCDSLYDSDLIMSRKRKALDEKPRQQHHWDGWMIKLWTRSVSSNFWEETLTVDVADISVDKSMLSVLLSSLRGEADLENHSFRNLYSGFPNLVTDGNDAVYLMCVSKFLDPDGGRMVAIDLGEKRVKAVGVHSLAPYKTSVKSFCPSKVSNIATEMEVSSCGSITQVGHFANDPISTPCCVGHPISCGSEKKTLRLLAKDANNGAPSNHISQVHPVENNLPLQQRFSNGDGPCSVEPGPSSQVI